MAFWLFILSALQSPETATHSYRCLDDTTFVLHLSEDLAIVEFPNAKYQLPRRSSNIAVKYATEQATGSGSV